MRNYNKPLMTIKTERWEKFDNFSSLINSKKSHLQVMSTSEKGFFTVLEQLGETKLKIQENVPESAEESIEIAQTGPAKTQDGKDAVVLKTTEGRQFARLEEWPGNLLLEISQS